jgi:hypothetical protein
MQASQAEQTARMKLLSLLACELRRPGGPGQGLRVRLRRSLAGRACLVAGHRMRHRALRVYCISYDGRFAFITSAGQMIGVTDLPAAARAVAAAIAAGKGD